MRNSITIACLFICCCISSMKAQDTIKKNMINSTKVTLVSNSSFHSKGALYQVNDSSIMLSNSFNPENYATGNSNFSLTEIDVIDIQLIKIKSKKRTRKGALIGAVSGFAVGLVWAAIESQQSSTGWGGPFFPAWQEALFGGALGATVGVVSGALIGSVGIHIPINGSMNNYNRNKAKLTKYSLKQ